MAVCLHLTVVWDTVTRMVIRSLTSLWNQLQHTKPVTPGGGGPRLLPPLPSSWGGGACLALAPQKELSFGLNRDPEAIKFILRTCCQRANKFICSFRQGLREILLHQVFACVFFFFLSPEGDVGVNLPNSALWKSSQGFCEKCLFAYIFISVGNQEDDSRLALGGFKKERKGKTSPKLKTYTYIY